jgi:hypothetical protein
MEALTGPLIVAVIGPLTVTLPTVAPLAPYRMDTDDDPPTSATIHNSEFAGQLNDDPGERTPPFAYASTAELSPRYRFDVPVF